jgi:hypothetical protein
MSSYMSYNDVNFPLSVDQIFIQEGCRFCKWNLERWLNSTNNCTAWEVSWKVRQSKCNKFLPVIIIMFIWSVMRSVFVKIILYLQFIKDLHVAFIKQVENLWNKLSTFLLYHWHHFLQTIEPTFIKFLHYLESAIWKASREILGKINFMSLELLNFKWSFCGLSRVNNTAPTSCSSLVSK